MKKFLSFKNLGLVALLVVAIAFAQVFSVAAQSTGVILNGNNLGNGNIGNVSITCGATSNNVHGYLFSSTIGWIALNCADNGNGNNNAWGVNQDANGFWSGYGWSSSIGWIKFGQGVGCPTNSGWNVVPATGASGCDVQRLSSTVGVTHPIVGWARACTFAANPATCSGGTNASAGGADGWISMSGLNDQNPTAALLQTTTNYGSNSGAAINLIPNNGRLGLSGFVWGGDVIGWARFSGAYVDTTVVQQNSAVITLEAIPPTVNGDGPTVLKYWINPAQKAYFTGAACTATATATGTGWSGSKANFSSASTIFETQVPGILVPNDPTTYTISCPVSIPGNTTQTVATASVTVTKITPTINFGITTHDLCVDGSLGGPQSTSASWTASSPNASYCKVFKNGTLVTTPQHTDGKQDPISSMAIGPFTSSTTNPYVTPVSAGSPNEYVVKCYSAANVEILPQSDPEFVGVAPASFNGTTANGTLNCTQPDWGITFGSTGANGAVCNGSSSTAASLSWSAWGTVPPQYTYAVLKKNANNLGNGSIYTTIGTFGLTDAAPNITAPGYYKVFYYTAGGVVAPVSSAQIYTSGQVASTNCFTGLPSGGGYCPAGSVNVNAILPQTYSWSSDAASCSLGGPNGSISITSAPTTKTLTCTWPDGSTASNTATYGPMLDKDSPFCSTIPKKGGNPSIIEN